MNPTDNQKCVSDEYIARINRVIDYIELHIDQSLTLDELAIIANFSKYHFHRIFYSIIGETLFQFIQRIRIEKAASLLISQPKKSITEISYECGFMNPSSFARKFKNYFGVSATLWRSEHRQNRNLNKTKSNMRKVVSNDSKDTLRSSWYIEHVGQSQIWRVLMNNEERTVEVKELSEMTVAYVRYVGPYKGDSELFESLYQKLFSWAGPRNLLHSSDAKSLVIYHDDPEITEETKLRISVCITIPEDTIVDGDIGKMKVSGGKYALAKFILTAADFEEAWKWVYGTWLPESGYAPDDRPCFELYPKDCNLPEGKMAVSICVPVKPL